MNKQSYNEWAAKRGPVGSLFAQVLKKMEEKGLLEGMTPDEKLLAVAAFIQKTAGTKEAPKMA